ncbi:MAG: hypothetical protein PWQ12_1794 [Clostridiales bacterium]|nr:hypothetical protein [Clostridiales bacterium]
MTQSEAKQLIKYLFVGFGAVAIDFLVYRGLLYWTPLDISLIKATSYILGALFAFVLNKWFTFQSDAAVHREFWKFAVLYGISFLTNVALNRVVYVITEQATWAFLVATGTTTVMNYVGQKFWVFAAKR